MMRVRDTTNKTGTNIHTSTSRKPTGTVTPATDQRQHTTARQVHDSRNQGCPQDRYRNRYENHDNDHDQHAYLGWDTDNENALESDGSEDSITTAKQSKYIYFEDPKSNNVIYNNNDAMNRYHDENATHPRHHRYRDGTRNGYDRAANQERQERDRQRRRDEQKRNRGTCNIDTSSESDDGNRKKIKSGINAKPTSNVKEQLKYPHFSLGQMSAFIGQEIKFHNLSYEQFVAGELTTIATCDDFKEIAGRTSLLQQFAVLMRT